MASEILRAAVYVRMSTAKQEDSPERQLGRVRPYCATKGYAVVGEYEDLGIAGDEFAKRQGLQRLLADARQRKFDVIVADEPSRLSRQDVIKFIATIVDPLRDAGVALDTVTDGPVAWGKLVDVLMMAIRQDKAADEPDKLSARVLSGAARHALGGAVLGGVPPYGYRVEYAEVAEPGRAPRLRPVRLVADEDKAKVVRWLFAQYATRDVSLQSLADELNARQAPPPARKGHRKYAGPKWGGVAVRVILTNAKYTGAMLWNRVTQAKYNRLAGGTLVGRRGRGGVKTANARADWVVTPDRHEALVSREAFDRVQEKLAANRGRGAAPVASGGHLLSGLLVCGHCGRTLQASTQRGTVYFRCRKRDDSDRVPCGYGAVKEEGVVRAVVKKLQSGLLAPERVAALREEITRQEEAERETADPAQLRRRVAEIDAEVEAAGRKLLRLPEDVHDVVVAEVRRLKDERARLAKELEDADGADAGADLDDFLAEAEAVLWDMKNALDEGDRAALRDALRRLVSRVAVAWDRRQVNVYTKHTFAGGVIYLWPGKIADLLTTLKRGSRGDTFATVAFGPEDMAG